MKRLVRQALRWTLVVCLIGILSFSPASAGWLLHQIKCGAPPACPPKPACKAPVVHYTAPVDVCCVPQPVCIPEPDPCCCEAPVAQVTPPVNACCDTSGAIIEPGISEGVVIDDMGMGEISSEPIYSGPMIDEVITSPPLIQGSDMPIESWSDSSTVVEAPSEPPASADSAVERPFDNVSKEPTIDDTADQPPAPAQEEPAAEASEPEVAATETPEPETPAPETTEPETPEPAMPGPDDLFGSDPVEPEPSNEPEPFVEPESGVKPAAAEEPVVPGIDDLFGDETPAETNEPAPAKETSPAADPAPADSSLDDLFGTGPADAPADPAPADPAPADSSLDDLFGTGPADAPAETSEPATDSSLDDLFGTGSSDAATDTTPPADVPEKQPSTEPSIDALFDEAPIVPSQPEPAEMPADDIPLDDLFGEPPTDGPTPGTTPESNESFDDLFGTPGGEGETDSETSSDLDDLFGLPSESTEPEAEGESNLSIDDLFGLHSDDSQSGQQDVDVVADEAKPSYVGELPAPVVADESDQQMQVVSAKTEPSLNPLAETRVRVWIDNTGGFRTEGRLIELGDDSIRLLKSNGKTCTVPTERLSDADAAYIDGIRSRIESMPLAMVTPR